MGHPSLFSATVVCAAHLGSVSVCIVDASVVALVQPLKGKRGEEKSEEVWKPGLEPGRPRPPERQWDTVSSSRVVLSVSQVNTANGCSLPGAVPALALKTQDTPQWLPNQDTGPAHAGSSSQYREGHLSWNYGVHCPKRASLPLTH